MKPLLLKFMIVLGIALIAYLATGIITHKKRYYFYSIDAPKREISKDLYEMYWESDYYENVDLEYKFNNSYAILPAIGVIAIGLIVVAKKELKS